jgi:Arc/MetJ-type ribon-helix-helix transcriptional regulator
MSRIVIEGTKEDLTVIREALRLWEASLTRHTPTHRRKRKQAVQIKKAARNATVTD